jgi:hypothetical protein
MFKGFLADYQAFVMSLDCPFFDAVYLPLRRVFGHSFAYWVADVFTTSARYFLLEHLAFWLAEDVIRARWSEEGL